MVWEAAATCTFKGVGGCKVGVWIFYFIFNFLLGEIFVVIKECEDLKNS